MGAEGDGELVGRQQDPVAAQFGGDDRRAHRGQRLRSSWERPSRPRLTAVMGQGRSSPGSRRNPCERTEDLAREWGATGVALRADDVDLDRDTALVERFQTGDEEAFADLYRRYFPRLRRYCVRRLGDPHEAEEAAQEALARAYRALPNLGGDRRFYPWLRVIASNLC